METQSVTGPPPPRDDSGRSQAFQRRGCGEGACPWIFSLGSCAAEGHCRARFADFLCLFSPGLSERPEERGPLRRQLLALRPRRQGHAAEPGVLPVPQGQVGPLGRAFPAQTSRWRGAGPTLAGLLFLLMLGDCFAPDEKEFLQKRRELLFFWVVFVLFLFFLGLLTVYCSILIPKSVKTTNFKYYKNVLFRK